MLFSGAHGMCSLFSRTFARGRYSLVVSEASVPREGSASNYFMYMC